MKPVICAGPSWFRSFPGSVVVYTPDGRPFYTRERKDGKPLCFSLPAGEYLMPEHVEPCKPRRRKLPALPPPERDLPFPAKFEVLVRPNPNKCTVYLTRGLIILDNALAASLSRADLIHIFAHEIGHFWYKTEWKCDVFAAHVMLLMGFNVSQAWEPNFTVIRNDKSGIHRKKKVTNHLSKVVHHEK